MMRYPATSNEYETIYLSWPKTIPKICPLCQMKLEMKYPDNGKIVHTLNGKVNQITYLYICISQTCYFHSHPFNSQPRFEFEGFYYGRDVVQKIAFYGIKEGFKPSYIASLLKNEYFLKISESTVRRMLAMAIVVKAEAIDARTYDLIRNQGSILLGLDGEDPLSDGPALWCFIDLLSNRVIHTVYLESAPAFRLQQEITLILQSYAVKLLGVVSDKQMNIVACMRDHFPGIPHQFCSFHFAQNLWNHIELMDGVLHKKISKMLNESYFLTQSTENEVNFEEHGKLKPKKVFEPIISALKKIRKIQTKKFERLRGLQLFEKLDEYAKQLSQEAARIQEGYRMQMIFQRELDKWTQGLTQVISLYDDVLSLFNWFQEIFKLLFAENIIDGDRECLLAHEFDQLEEILVETCPNYDRAKLKAFLPSGTSNYNEVLGEWIRLWHRYRPGLFVYLKFPKPVQTTVILERGFGQQKSRFYSRVAKKRIGQMIQTEGDYHLRFVFCDPKELESNIWEEAIQYNWKQLVEAHSERKQEISARWNRKKGEMLEILDVSYLYYEERLT